MKVYLVSLAFVPARIAIESMKQIYATIGNIQFEHKILMQHYPINKELNDKLLTTLFNHYNCTIYDLGKNVGLSAGYNYLIQQCNLQPGDIVIGSDLDVNPIGEHWGKAIVDVINTDPTIGWVSLQNQHSERELNARGFTTHTINNRICYEGHDACVQSIVGWSAASLQGMNGLEEQSKWYGGGEVVSYPKLKALGLRWVYLAQYKEAFSPLCESDGPYRHYKWNLAHLRTTTLDFESWLNEDPERLKLK